MRDRQLMVGAELPVPESQSVADPSGGNLFTNARVGQCRIDVNQQIVDGIEVTGSQVNISARPCRRRR